MVVVRIAALVAVALLFSPAVATAQTLCTNTCEYAHDGECDDGGANSLYDLCALGTDCSDCGPRTPVAANVQVNAMSIQGTWFVDWDPTLVDLSPAERAELTPLLSQYEISLFFAPDGTMSMRINEMGQVTTQDGTWSVQSRSGNTLVLIADTYDGTTPVTEEMHIRFRDLDHIEISAPDDPEILYFRRSQ